MYRALPIATLFATSLLLTACGGGSGQVDVTVAPPPSAAFDLGVRLNGQPVAGIDVFPDDQQTVQVQVGDTVEFDSSGAVYWETVAGSSGGIPTQTGGTLLYEDAAITENLSNSAQLVLTISATNPLSVPVPVTLYATSLDDGSQTARIDLVITN